MRWLWGGLGFLFLGIGAVGILIPLWPTTVFWILAVFCLAESHPKVRDWIYTRPGVGGFIESFVERGEISRKGKIGAVVGIVPTALLSAWLFRQNLIPLTIMLVVLLGITIYILTRPEPSGLE